ncbi:MAG TPA: 5-(carboxyamino)imidazole ribonucleotide mutase [Phycisphaeraceae bacterium]|nr:5-(carboxyamino)imidazole ribonucleotide mutase [Phycisphaeraceae bacterium]
MPKFEAENPVVAVIMGSKTDWDIMKRTHEVLADLELEHEVRVYSAHRTPHELSDYIDELPGRGCRVIIAAAGGAAHLAGVIASKPLLPVIGVPLPAWSLDGLDSLLSTAQMPRGIPVASMAIGTHGAINAALFAAQILALNDETVREKLRLRREEQAQDILRGQLE